MKTIRINFVTFIRNMKSQNIGKTLLGKFGTCMQNTLRMFNFNGLINELKTGVYKD